MTKELELRLQQLRILLQTFHTEYTGRTGQTTRSVSVIEIYRQLTLRNVTNHNTFIDLPRSQS
jgi:hypothetical protein